MPNEKNSAEDIVVAIRQLVSKNPCNIDLNYAIFATN